MSSRSVPAPARAGSERRGSGEPFAHLGLSTPHHRGHTGRGCAHGFHGEAGQSRTSLPSPR